MSLIQEKASVIHPILFAIFPVIFLFSYNVSEMELVDIGIPSIMLATITLIGFAVIGGISKNYIKSGLVVSTFLFLFFFYGHFYNILNNTLVDAGISIGHKIPLIGFLVLFIIITIYLIRTKKKFDNLTKIITAIITAMILISLVTIATYYISDTSSVRDDIIDNESNIVISKSTYPNIYYIILDGYGHQKYLLKNFNFDNSEFLSSLKKMGFNIPDNSRSNYPSTGPTIAANLNMMYVHDLISQTGKPNINKLYNLTKNNAVMKFVETRGYETYNIDSGFVPTRHLDVADHNICGTGILINSELSSNIFGISMLKPVYANYFTHYDRERVLCQFDKLNNIYQTAEKPFFVFAHINSPHIPYIFGPNGEEVIPENLELGDPDNHKDIDAYIGQLQFINKKVLEAVSNILADENSNTIIVIQSDHGTRYIVDDYIDPTDDGIRERLSILNAYYLPDGNYGIFGEINTPVNTFRKIFNSYLDSDFEILENRNYFATVNQIPLIFWEVTDIVN